MLAPDPLRQRARRAAAQLLAELAGDGVQPEGPVEAAASDGEIEVRVIVVRKGEQELPGNANRLAAGNRLTALDRRILAAATRDEQAMPKLARLAGHDNDSYFRSRVKRLVEAGRLATEFGGYRLA